jgi:NAD(P)-dependent dehydrogenase (short-subunit alcohol dehydrogenase family)
MKWIVTTALAAASALAVAQVEARTAGISAKLRPDRIDIAYVEPKSAANQPVYKLLKEHRVLEKIRELLRPLRLPHRLLLQTTDCDKAKVKAPARSLVSIDDVGVATAFLAHDAARLLTGETLYVDGGYHIID